VNKVGISIGEAVLSKEVFESVSIVGTYDFAENVGLEVGSLIKQRAVVDE